jgi:hypothetical protein
MTVWFIQSHDCFYFYKTPFYFSFSFRPSDLGDIDLVVQVNVHNSTDLDTLLSYAAGRVAHACNPRRQRSGRSWLEVSKGK